MDAVVALMSHKLWKWQMARSMNSNDTLNPLLLAYVADGTQSNYFILIPFKKGTPFILVWPVVSDNMQAKGAKLRSAYQLHPFKQASATIHRCNCVCLDLRSNAELVFMRPWDMTFVAFNPLISLWPPAAAPTPFLYFVLSLSFQFLFQPLTL